MVVQEEAHREEPTTDFGLDPRVPPLFVGDRETILERSLVEECVVLIQDL
jgi:hypothetical protein